MRYSVGPYLNTLNIEILNNTGNDKRSADEKCCKAHYYINI